MPTTSCPYCHRSIPFELHESHNTFQCAKCGGIFTPIGGAVAGGQPKPQPAEPQAPAGQFRFPCPHCQRSIRASEEQIGKRVACPKCRGHIWVPRPHAEPASQRRSSMVELVDSEPTGATLLAPAVPAAQVLPSIRFACPHCRTSIEARAQQAGEQVKCQTCGLPLLVPIPQGELPPAVLPLSVSPEVGAALAIQQPPPALQPRTPAPFTTSPAPPQAYPPADLKYCHTCGQQIRAQAEICPKCGVRQPVRAADAIRPGPSREGVKVPILISAISNIVVGLFWASLCFGFIFTIPMIVLCIFEFILWSRADTLPVRRLGEQAKTLGIFEIIVGLFNTVAFVCGIIVLINGGKLASYYEE